MLVQGFDGLRAGEMKGCRLCVARVGDVFSTCLFSWVSAEGMRDSADEGGIQLAKGFSCELAWYLCWEPSLLLHVHGSCQVEEKKRQSPPPPPPPPPPHTSHKHTKDAISAMQLATLDSDLFMVALDFLRGGGIGNCIESSQRWP